MYKLILTTMTCALLAMPWAPAALAGNGYSPLVRQLLYARDDDDREDAAEDLAKYGTPADILYLQWSAAHDPEGDVRKEAAKAIQKIQRRYRQYAPPPPAPVDTAPPTTYVAPTPAYYPSTTYVAPTPTYYPPTTYVAPTPTYYPPTTYVAPTRTYYVAPTYVAPRVTIVRRRPAVTYRARRRARTYTHTRYTRPKYAHRSTTYRRPTTVRHHGTRRTGSYGRVGVSIGSHGGGVRVTYSGKSFSIRGKARW